MASAPRTAAGIKDALDANFMLFIQVQQLLAELDRSLDSGVRRAPARHLVILGGSGVGKSCLLEHFLSKHPRVETEDRTLVPVLLASMPATPTQRRILEALIGALDPALPAKGSIEGLKHQLLTLCNACGVSLIVMDEASHMVDRGQERTHYLVGDALKEVVDFLGRPFVLAGIPRLKRLFEVNEQLRRRFNRCRTLKPFSLTVKESAADFRGAVQAFANELVGIETVDLAGQGVLPQMFVATNGLLKPLVDLLKDAVDLAMSMSRPAIKLETLAAAFRSAIWQEAPRERNPFDDKFNGFPLINPGEPYAAPERG
jgi:GTPase SAR1 family protein